VFGSGHEDIGWFRPDGLEMQPEDWHVPYARAIAIFLNGRALGPQGPTVAPAHDSSFLLFVNAGAEPVAFTVPPDIGGAGWQLVLDSADDAAAAVQVAESEETKVGAWSIRIFERRDAHPLEGGSR
jgi:glycogen operon protein